MASRSIIPDEIMIEILLQLPVKYMLRCKTLSKHYYSLINSQFFIHRHRALGRLNHQLIISPTLDSVHLFDTRGHIEILQTPSPFADEPSNYNGHAVCGPVEGLYWVVDRIKDDGFAVWNPSTREYFLLPRIPQKPIHLYDRGCYAYGLGYDDITNDYKFVLIYSLDSIETEPFNIFSVSEGRWRSFENWPGVVPQDIIYPIGVFVHCACHWQYTEFTILAFDMRTESHRFIALPAVGDEYVWSTRFMVSLRGCLGLVNSQKEDDGLRLYTSFDVWVMTEYGVTESWTILHRVKLPADGIGCRRLGIVRDRFYIRKVDGGFGLV